MTTNLPRAGKKRQLITHGEGAGTPDRVSKDINNLGTNGHQVDDVVNPARWAQDLDNGKWGKYSEMYNEVRPPK
jgi:hypothetical protein